MGDPEGHQELPKVCFGTHNLPRIAECVNLYRRIYIYILYTVYIYIYIYIIYDICIYIYTIIYILYIVINSYVISRVNPYESTGCIAVFFASPRYMQTLRAQLALLTQF